MAKKILNLEYALDVRTSYTVSGGAVIDSCWVQKDDIEYLYIYSDDEYNKLIETINNNRYTLGVGHKFYIDKKANVPRIKLQNIVFDNLIDIKSNITEASHLFIQDPINHMIGEDYFYQVSKEQIVQFLNLCVNQEELDNDEVEFLLDKLEPYQDDDIVVVTNKVSTFINSRSGKFYQGAPLCENLLERRQERRKRIEEDYVKEFLHIENNLDKTYHYRELLPYMNGDETITIDETVYNQLNNMFKSEDKDNHILAMEIMANCNYKESIMYLLVLIRDHNYAISRERSRTHVNFKSLLGYLGLTHHELYIYAHRMIDIMLERNLLTLEKIQYVFDKYQSDFISLHSDYISIHQITLSPELAEKLNVDYVKELTPRYKVKEVEEKEEEVKPEVSNEISWV